MDKLTTHDIAKVTRGELVSAGCSGPIKGFSIDSRTISRGDIFIAVRGRSFDGHDFIEQALSRGAGGVVYEKDRFKPDRRDGNFVSVADTIEAMASIAAEIRRRSGLRMICVTGTNGKTTVKDITARLLSSEYNVLKSRASYNNIFGVCLTLFELTGEHDAAVLELGTNSPGEIRRLSFICSPDIAVITNVGYGHLEMLEGRKGVFREKISILEGIKEGGVALINADDDILSEYRDSPRCRIARYGRSEDCRFRISDEKVMHGGTGFRMNGEELFIPAYGAHNVENAAAAAGTAAVMGILSEEIRRGLAGMVLPPMRMERTEIEDIVFINDAYNADPGSFKAALETLGSDPRINGLWVVAGDMCELGERSLEFHRRLGKEIAFRKPDMLITLGELSEETLRSAKENGLSESSVLSVRSHEQAARFISENAEKGTTVLIKGSRSMRMEEIIKCFMNCCTP